MRDGRRKGKQNKYNNKTKNEPTIDLMHSLSLHSSVKLNLTLIFIELQDVVFEFSLR
jgi:hypothetical protein